MNQKRIHISKETLEDLYLIKFKNPYEIAEILKCNHKTIRKNLKEFDIPLRTRSEYNALSSKSYTNPSDSSLFSRSSLILHSIYKCEGCTAQSSKYLRFQNQDPTLIILFCEGIKNIYKYQTKINVKFLYNFECENSNNIVSHYSNILKNYNIIKVNIKDNKNPIIRVSVGGRYLFNLFMENTKRIIDMVIL